MKLTADENKAYLTVHGHENVDYLDDLLAAANRHFAAARETLHEIVKRRSEAIIAYWAKITDDEVMASEPLRVDLIKAAHSTPGDLTLYNRLHTLVGRPSAGVICTEAGDEDTRPSYELHLYELNEPWRSSSREQTLADLATAIARLGELWALGRRLIKMRLLIPDAHYHKAWIEYEPATGRARLMGQTFGDLSQLVYADLADVLLAAEAHTEMVAGMGR